MDANARRPRRLRRILLRLLRGGGIQLNRVDKHRIGGTLRQHQGDKPAAAADIEHPARISDRRPGAQQNGVGADFHGAAVVRHEKLFEGETVSF